MSMHDVDDQWEESFLLLGCFYLYIHYFMSGAAYHAMSTNI